MRGGRAITAYHRPPPGGVSLCRSFVPEDTDRHRASSSSRAVTTLAVWGSGVRVPSAPPRLTRAFTAAGRRPVSLDGFRIGPVDCPSSIDSEDDAVDESGVRRQ